MSRSRMKEGLHLQRSCTEIFMYMEVVPLSMEVVLEEGHVLHRDIAALSQTAAYVAT